MLVGGVHWNLHNSYQVNYPLVVFPFHKQTWPTCTLVKVDANKRAGRANGSTSEKSTIINFHIIFISSPDFNITAMSLRSTEVFFFLTVCTALAWAEQNCTCGLHIPGRVVKFKDCQEQPANWRSHDHPDLGITGDCLTQFKVPVK